MVGGTIAKIVRGRRSQVLLVLASSSEAEWRRVSHSVPVEVGDYVRWEGHVGFLTTRDALYRNHRIGNCISTVKPTREWNGKAWVSL